MSTPQRRPRALIASFLLALLAFAAPALAQGTITRTPWQMYRNAVVAPVPDYGSHGNLSEYQHAPPIPPATANVPPVSGNGGWMPAPNGATIGFGGPNESRLGGYPCRQALDFTFFQTLVTIPANTTVTEFKIAFSGMDDGSRVSIFNTLYPDGLVIPGSYVSLGASGTTNLKDYVVAGETNRVVITQVDDCATGNNLQSASVVLNGNVVQTGGGSAPPTFSLPFDAPDGACICTPLLMNTNQNGFQTWYVRADANGGPLTFKVAAVAVAPGIAQTVRAEVFPLGPNAAAVADIAATYSAAQAVPGFTAESVATVTALPNAVYRVRVTTPDANSLQAHFRLKADGAQAIGTVSPSSPSFEHEELMWHFNVGTGENLKVDVMLANPPDPSVTVMYDLFDPSGAFHSTGSVNAPGSITVPSAQPGTWGLHVHPSGHYRLNKDGGADRGIYLAWDSVGAGTLQAVAADGNTGNPNFTSDMLEFVVYDSSNIEIARQTTTTGVVNFARKFAAGVYRVRILAPPGHTPTPNEMTVTIMCDRPAVANFVVADLTPPVIEPLPNLTLQATGPNGADASWTAVAYDPGRGPVAVTCTPPSGGTFAIGTTAVECNAVDLAGNAATPVAFTIRVIDTTAPAGVCTPSVNPSGKNVPQASRQNEDGFYRVSSSDIVTNSPSITLGAFTLLQGETVKFTQSPGLNGVVLVGTMGPQRVRHFRVGPGDPVLTFTDEAGNTSTRTCFVAPVPK